MEEFRGCCLEGVREGREVKGTGKGRSGRMEGREKEEGKRICRGPSKSGSVKGFEITRE